MECYQRFSLFDPPAGAVTQLKLRSEIGLGLAGERGEIPLLVLGPPEDREVWTETPLRGCGKVIQTSTASQKLIHLLMPVSQLHAGARRKRIFRPGLSAQSLASNPASDNVSVIGIAGVVAPVDIHCP